MIRSMHSHHLYRAGRVTAWLTLAVFATALVITAFAVSRMHPPRALAPQGPKTSGLQLPRSTASSASTAPQSASAAPDFASA